MLEVLLSSGRVLLAAVFAVAAAGKLLDLEGTRDALRAFGAPRSLVVPLALLLPVAELAVAALLVPTPSAVVGAAGALALLLAFSAAIAANLARGHTPDCHCFGSFGSAPAGQRTLARNGALAAVAALTLAGSLAEPGTATFAWAGDLSGAEVVAVALGIALAVVVAAGAAAFLTLLRSYGSVLVRLGRLEEALGAAGYELGGTEPPGLEPGDEAPGFTLEDLTGESEVTLRELLGPGLPVLLVFTSPGCAACEALMPDLAGWQVAHADRLTVAVVAEGEPDELRVHAEHRGLRRVLADADGELYDAYEAAGTPSAVLVAPDGAIGSRLAVGPSRIVELVAGVLDSPGLPVGAPAPPLDGLQSGGESLVVLWNPDCGHCSAMREELVAWAAEADDAAPRLVVVSGGTEERLRAEGFATAVLDPDWSTGRALGATGTPTAVLVDAEGRIASELLVGAQAILARVRGPRPIQVG